MMDRAQNDATDTPFHTGVLNCALGFFGIIISSVAMGLPSDIVEGDFGYSFVGTGEGVWCGIFLISTGIVGILTKAKATASSRLYLASGILAILTSVITFVGFGLCLAAIYMYSFVLGNATITSLYTMIATLCFAGIPSCIVHATYSFRTRSYNNALGDARFERYDRECAVDVTTPSGQSGVISMQSYTNAIFGLGTAEVVFGVIIFSLNIACVSITEEEARDGTRMEWLAFGHAGVGMLWSGIFICLSGTAGIVHKYKPDIASININLSLSMLGGSTSIIILIVNSIAAINNVRILIALHATIAVSSLFAMVICIVHSSLCCKSICTVQEEGVVVAIARVPISSIVPNKVPVS